MMSRPYLLHALSPLHAGVGQAAELIDLPIARLKGSGIPFVPGSSIKGVLRDADSNSADKREAIYGPDQANADKFMGALICADARLLALPVRSFFGTFAYVTCPLLLSLAARDLDKPPAVPAISPPAAPNQQPGCMALRGLLTGPTGSTVYLEDLDLALRQPDVGFTQWQNLIASAFGTPPGTADVFRNRFAIVDDEIMTFLWESATQLDQRVRIDPDTRTVAEHALWLEESLPPETLMIGLLLAEQSRKPRFNLAGADILKKVLDAPRILQFGGKSTVGRGRCRMVKL
jgi:CRISPR-associated protein Cmr4